MGVSDKSTGVRKVPGDMDKNQIRGDEMGNLNNVFRKKLGQAASYLTCLYTDVRSMGNTQEELELFIQLQKYD